ncbi:MAG: YfhO family protein, partial [Parasporobacterium sp.]|nr:YfhO family protein [Parasporobacterium sp.]
MSRNKQKQRHVKDSFNKKAVKQGQSPDSSILNDPEPGKMQKTADPETSSPLQGAGIKEHAPAVTSSAKKWKSFLFNNRYIFFTFIISLIIVLATYILKGIYPFGKNTILQVDLFHQYAPYLEEMRHRILSGQSLLYSWEGGLGKDFLSQTAYYTTSPLNLLIFYFPQKGLPEAIAIFILIKICLAGSSFSWYIQRHFRRSDLSVTAFGLFYAFCAFVTCYYWNIMWMDTVAVFPFVAMGVEEFVKNDKKVLYYVSLTLTMIVNFYLAVLVCVLIALYYLVQLFSAYDWKRHRKLMIRRTVFFGIVSILCACSSMFILAPVYVALQRTATSETAFPELTAYSNIWQFAANHFIGARAAVLARNEDLPNIYTGVLTMMLLPVYWSDTKEDKRGKILLTSMLVFMLLCSIIKPLDFMIHGMHFPSNL